MEWISELDGQLLLSLREACASPLMDKLMVAVSTLGDGGFLWIGLGILFLLIGWKKKIWRNRGLLLLFSLGADALVCNVLLKPLVGRPRPYEQLGFDILVAPLGDPSFPSGHTAASFAAATAIYAMNRKWGVAAYIFSSIMGFSRLYLGVHFPTDVIVGAILGTVMAKAVVCLFRKKRIWVSD